MSEREKFEKWFQNTCNQFNVFSLARSGESLQYEDMSVQDMWVGWQAALSTRKVYGFGVISKTEPQRLVYETQRSAEMESSYLNKHCKEGSPFRPVELFYEDSES